MTETVERASAIAPTMRERWRASLRMMFGRGDDSACCSFCGKNRREAHTIIVGPGVAICWRCASIASHEAHAETLAAPHNAARRVSVSGLLEMHEKLPEDRRGDAPALLAEVARAEHADLLAWTIACRNDAFADEAHFVVTAPADVDAAALAVRLRAAARRRLGLSEPSDATGATL